MMVSSSLLKRTAVVLLSVVIVSFLVPAVAFLWFLGFVVFSFSGTADLPADCGLVFGAAVHGGSQPGPGIARRVGAAAELYGRGDLQQLIFTGGRGSSMQESEAAVMQALAVRLGVDPADTVLEDQSRSTLENLRFSRPLAAQCGSVVAVSDRYHLGRIRFLAAWLKWGGVQTYPADPAADRVFEVRSAIREALGIGYYMLFGVEDGRGEFDGGMAEDEEQSL